MKTPISSIRNLGPKTEAAFERIGIRSAEELHEMGAEEAYRRLLLAGRRPHFIGFYVIVLGLQGRPWNDLSPEGKAKLRVVFDDLVASVQGKVEKPSDIEIALDALGVVAPRD